MSFFTRLLFIAIAAGTLLVGIQLPNFVDQYEKRLDAHFIEVQTNLKPFQDIANQFHNGSMEELILKHKRSDDPTFNMEGDAIDKMYRRFQRFANERGQLQTALPQQLLFIASRADRELVEETRNNYSFGLLLNTEAVIAGFVLMFCVIVVLELMAAIVRTLLRPSRGPLD